MSLFEYSAIPAPIRSEKAKAAKTPAERYALTLTDEINRMAGDGWEYLRAETLPSEERSGLTGRTTLFHNLLIFRRPKPAAVKHRALTEAEVKPTAPAPASKPAEPAPPRTAPVAETAENPGPRRQALSARPPRRFFRNPCASPKSRPGTRPDDPAGPPWRTA